MANKNMIANPNINLIFLKINKFLTILLIIKLDFLFRKEAKIGIK